MAVKQPPRVHRPPLVTAIATVVLVMVGAVVRSTGSGLGCPDWPTCYGSWIPPLEKTAIIEYTHRTVASLVGLMVVGVVVWAFRRRRSEPVLLRWSVLALVLVSVAGALGRSVVLTELEWILVLAHLVTAISLLAVLILLTVRRGLTSAVGQGVVGRTWAGFVAVTVVLVAGSLVTGTNSALAFSDWPLMAGSLLPNLATSAQALMFTHRMVTLVGVGYMIYLAFSLRRQIPHSLLARLAAGVVGLLLVEVVVGAAQIWFTLNPVAVAAHLTLATLAWAGAFLLALLSHRGRPAAL